MKVKTTSKKILFMMICMIMVVTVIGAGFIVSAENDCTHPNLSEANWDIVTEANCSVMGKKTQWCYDCGTLVEKEIPFDESAHVPGGWETVVPSSCTAPGVEKYECILCFKELGTREIPMHDLSVLYKTEATCVRTGYELSYCTKCLDVFTKEIPIDKDAHNYSDWYIIKEATCKGNSGERERDCLNYDENNVPCNASEFESYTDKDNHLEIQWDTSAKVAPTCKADGYTPGECLTCGDDSLKIIHPQHSESSYIVLETTPSTCRTNGSEYRKCVCGLEYTAELPLDEKNHEYIDWIIKTEPGCEDGLRFKVCRLHNDAVIEEAIPKTGEHRMGEWETVEEPDCSTTGLQKRACEMCDYEETKVLATKHDYTEWTVVSEMDCSEDKMIDGRKLAKCNECNYEKYFLIPAVHNFTPWKITKKADCKTGKAGEMTRYCTNENCGKTETKEYYVEHDFTEWYTIEKPICATDKISGKSGLARRWCNSCKYTEEKSLPATHECTDWEIIEYPTCTGLGSKVGNCKYCGIEMKETLSAEHKMGEWVETPSVCTGENAKAGKKVRTCILCDKYSEEEALPLHNFGPWVYADGHSCTNPGNYLVRYCQAENCNAMEEKKENIKNHPNLATVTIKPTCSTSGYTLTYCPDCDYEDYTDIVSALGHDLDEYWTTKHEPTCHSSGSRYKACANCDYIEYVEVDKADHILITLEPAVDPTCTLAGKSAKSYCGVCGDVFEAQEIAPTGHKYAEDSEICSVCYAYKNSDNCVCACHSTSGIESIVFMILNKIYQAFGINQQCSCGILHYEEAGFLAKLFGKG